MALRNLLNFDLDSKIYLSQINNVGNLNNDYAPFKNLIKEDIIDNFKTINLKVDLNTPINIEVQDSFDGSVNLILNNDREKPKMINSRFSVQENNTYQITDHKGNKDTNLYDDSQLDLDTRLYKTINKIPSLTFNGLTENGKMKCGSYHFYFKLSDNDGNETDFISESGLVVCHIGNYKDPGSVRMGMIDENSGKSISFTLSNLDSSYDFIKVYYTRTTSDNSQEDIVTAHYIDSKFSIVNSTSNIIISGFEVISDISLSEINPTYEIVDTVKAQAQCQNILFFGNVNKVTIPYKELEDLSLRFIPSLESTTENIGNLNGLYEDKSGKKLFEYYNPSNLYYNLGYWPEEYYRFGIVYILNDYTLSPVFNTRGLNFDISESYSNHPVFSSGTIRSYIKTTEDGFISGGINTFENAKGVIKINKKQVIFSDGVKPIGIKFTNENIETLTEIKKYTKGFFIVRQERIPTIYAQGLSIYKTKNDYGNIPVIKNYGSIITQHFLNNNRNLEATTLSTTPLENVEGKAAIIPEASIKPQLFNQIFTSSEFKLTKALEQTSSFNKISFKEIYILDRYTSNSDNKIESSLLTMVNDGLSLTTNGKDYFSSKAGHAEQAWNTIDVINSWTNNSYPVAVNTILSNSSSLIRGEFGTYVGLSIELPNNTIFNVRNADFSDSVEYTTNMFKTRMDSSEPYTAISDRTTWATTNTQSITVFRGDCFVGNFTHRMNRNFIDPDFPTNHKIVDKNTWKKNYAVYNDGNVNNLGINRQLITYKSKDNGVTIVEPSDAKYTNVGTGLGTLFDSFEYKIYGCDKINRGDVNAVPLGHWVTFKVMSNINLSMRDIDFSNPTEEAIHGKKRGFYPLNAMDPNDSLPESNIINGAANVTLSKRPNFIVPDVPFIKNYFGNRILYSDIATTDAFKNGYRVFNAGHYRDYTKTYGSIVDMKEWYGNLFVTMEHGCLLIPVNERAIAGEGQGGNVYINTSNVLPENPKVISDLFGSTWQESVVKTKSGVYGIDTVAKKIWKAAPNEGGSMSLECISDLKVQRFLNENIDLKESDKLPTIGVRNVKSHYNKNKGDIMFTFYSETKEWNLCYNENLQKFITYYSWTPSHSANINNVFFSFNKEVSKNIYNHRNYFNKTHILTALNSGGSLRVDDYEWILTGIQTGEATIRINNVITENGYWTVSFELASSQNVTGSINIDVCDNPGGNVTMTSDNQWTRVFATANISNYNSTHHFVDLNLQDFLYYKIKNIKVEKGSIATNYLGGYAAKLWKHGQSGIYNNQGKILPTNWYGEQHPFSFEFVVTENPSVQKIYNNLKLISNKAEPSSFEFEVVGEGYEWFDYKDIIVWISNRVTSLHTGNFANIDSAYTYMLSHTQDEILALDPLFPTLFNKPGDYIIPKLPYIPRTRYINPVDVTYSIGKDNYELNTSNTSLVTDNLLSEDKVHTEQLGNDLRKYGRTRGNMQYLEDCWDIEIKPINFKYAYIRSSDNSLQLTDNGKEARIRDKYVKIKVKYSGKDLAIIQGIKTTFTQSYS